MTSKQALWQEVGARLYLSRTHVLLFICTSGILYTNNLDFLVGLYRV